MAALTSENYQIAQVVVGLIHIPVAAATKIFQGALVGYDANGNAVPMSDTAGLTFAGVASRTVDNITGAAGDAAVPVNTPEVWELIQVKATGADDTWGGKDVFAVDDQEVALAATTVNDIKVGKCVAIESATSIIVATLR